MTEQMVKQIKKILKKENVKIKSVYFDQYIDESKSTLRVKVTEFIERSKLGYDIEPTPTEQRNKETQETIIKVLMALSNNGLRPEYRTEQRTNTNALGTWDSRYIIFK